MPKKRSKKKKSLLNSTTAFYEKNRLFIPLAIAGLIAVSFYYIYILLSEEATLRTGIIDWGVEQGYTLAFWGIILVIISIFMLAYPSQQRIRSDNLDKIYKIVIAFPLGFALYLIFFYQFMINMPQIKILDIPAFDLNDKIMHFLVGLVLTLAAVSYSPRKSTVLLVFFILIAYEFLEFIWFVYLSGFYEIHFRILPYIDELLQQALEGAQALFFVAVPIEELEKNIANEMLDVFPDIIANSLGILVGYFFVRDKISETERRVKRRKRK